MNKASSENAKLIIVAGTRTKAKKNLPRTRDEEKDARMAAVETKNREASELVLSFHLSMALRVATVPILKRPASVWEKFIT